MEKEYNLSTAQFNTENANPESIGPSSDELKNRFKAGSIPLQTDYSDLIDIADIGRRAAGKAPDQTNNPNSALELDNSSGLKVKTNPTGGISIDSSGIAVKCWPSGGITVTDGSGLYLKLVGGNSGNGWSGVSGLGLSSDGVKVKASNGINVDSNGVAVKTSNSTIKVEPTGISVKLGWGVEEGDGLNAKGASGIHVDWKGIHVTPDTTTGIMVTEEKGVGIYFGDGLQCDPPSYRFRVKAGNGIKVDDKGVSIDPDKVLPRGMIVMFSGSVVPQGWAFCDGTNGTPDLRDRFVSGAWKLSDAGNTNDKRITGDNKNKAFNAQTTADKTNLSVSVQDTTLTIDQIPSHSHIEGMRMQITQAAEYGLVTQKANQLNRYNLNNQIIHDSNEDYSLHKTNEIGGGKAHNHQTSVNETAHQHTVSVSPPYYILAFIMKI